MFTAKQRGVDINQTKRLFVALVCLSLIYANTMKLCAGISRIRKFYLDLRFGSIVPISIRLRTHRRLGYYEITMCVNACHSNGFVTTDFCLQWLTSGLCILNCSPSERFAEEKGLCSCRESKQNPSVFSLPCVCTFYTPSSGVPRGDLGFQPPPPEIPKGLQNRTKLNPIVKTVKNCWKFRTSTPQGVRKKRQ